MLQQTQVATVIPYFKKFTEAFPRLSDLAEASEEQVLSLWAGLGYYSRARNLHQGAQFILKNHQGFLPQTRKELLEVPGIGPYTAGAILSIAFGLKEPLVDGNVERVFTRLFGWDKPIDSGPAKTFFWQKASELVALSNSPKHFNQSLMELGSLICTKSSPRCELCPVSESCEAFRVGKTQEWPFKAKKIRYQKVTLLKYFIEWEDQYLLSQNNEGKWWKGLWDVPTEECPSFSKWETQAKAFARKLKAKSWKEGNHYTHTVTHHKLTVVPLTLRLSKKPKLPGSWVNKSDLRRKATSALLRKIVLQEL